MCSGWIARALFLTAWVLRAHARAAWTEGVISGPYRSGSGSNGDCPLADEDAQTLRSARWLRANVSLCVRHADKCVHGDLTLLRCRAVSPMAVRRQSTLEACV